jgi:hypothetical protein
MDLTLQPWQASVLAGMIAFSDAPGGDSRGASPARASFSVRPAKTRPRGYASFCKGVPARPESADAACYVTRDIRTPLFVPDEALGMEGGAE